jgi:ribosomal protein S18 acetylase RimI-like enzyme
MMRCFDSDLQRTEQIQGIQRKIIERHYSLPSGVLSQGQIAHFVADLNLALWTDAGGIVACSDENLAASIAEVIAGHEGEDYAALLSKLQEILSRSLPAASCKLCLYFYCCSAPTLLNNDLRSSIEMLRPDDSKEYGRTPVPHKGEHSFVIRDGSVIVAHAWNVPRDKVDNLQFHAVGVGTHPDYRRRGLGKAVVSALIEHIISEGGVALWSANAKNIASRRLARSVGFVEDIRHFSW